VRPDGDAQSNVVLANLAPEDLMSYDVAIVAKDFPSSDALAWPQLDALIEQQGGAPL
jgi:hypothetical protein